jgi:hypothetical protein
MQCSGGSGSNTTQIKKQMKKRIKEEQRCINSSSDQILSSKTDKTMQDECVERRNDRR